MSPNQSSLVSCFLIYACNFVPSNYKLQVQSKFLEAPICFFSVNRWRATAADRGRPCRFARSCRQRRPERRRRQRRRRRRQQQRPTTGRRQRQTTHRRTARAEAAPASPRLTTVISAGFTVQFRLRRPRSLAVAPLGPKTTMPMSYVSPASPPPLQHKSRPPPLPLLHLQQLLQLLLLIQTRLIR